MRQPAGRDTIDVSPAKPKLDTREPNKPPRGIRGTDEATLVDPSLRERR